MITLSRLPVIRGLAIGRWPRILSTLRRWFTIPTAPLNLAVFRIVVFYQLFHTSQPSQMVWFSQLPEALRFPAEGSGWLFTMIPLTPVWTAFACMVLRATSLAAMLGFWTRSTAMVATLLGVYVLGIPQLFGKVNHGHLHVVWFAALLAVSRCADALSGDALISAWRHARQGMTTPPRSSRVYTYPLRFVWLLMGVIYFFPGFWKWWSSGLGWAFSDNVKYLLYRAWWKEAQMTGSIESPLWWIARAPAYQVAGLAVMCFEIGFLWCLFSPRWRTLAACGGLLFHAATARFMFIRFTSLQACYVAFLDWATGLRRIGQRVFKEPLYFVYDGGCVRCCRVVALVRLFDWLARVAYRSRPVAAGTWPRQAHRHWHVLWRRTWWNGTKAFCLLARRIPILWPAVPWFELWSAVTSGRQPTGRSLPASLCGSLPRIHQAGSSDSPADRPVSAAAVIVMGCFLLAGNGYYGARRRSAAWPLSCYPTFEWIATQTVTVIRLVGIDPEHRLHPVDVRRLQQRFGGPRWEGLLRHVISTPDLADRRRRLVELWQLIARGDPRLHTVQRMQVTEVEWSLAQAVIARGVVRWPTKPSRERVVEELRVDDHDYLASSDAREP